MDDAARERMAAQMRTLIGRRVLIQGNHPWAGYTGEIVRVDETLFGPRPVVRIHDPHGTNHGHECMLVGTEDARPLP